MTGRFLGCINEALNKGEIDADTADLARQAYEGAYASADRTLGPEDADREAGKATLDTLKKADIERQRQRTLSIRTRRNLLDGIAGYKERRGYTGVQVLGDGTKPPKGGWVQGGAPPADGPFKAGAGAAKALPLLMRNKGGLSGGPFPSVEGRSLAIRGQFDAGMAELMERFQTRLGLDSPNRAVLDNVGREGFGEKTGDEAAARMAKSWGETAELSRRMFNAAGGAIGKLEGWGFPQVHDAAAIYKAGKQAWVDFTFPELAVAKMTDKYTGAPFTEKRLRAVMGETWDRIVTHGLIDRKPGEHLGQGALAGTRAEERFFIYKDWASWQRYQQQFGGGDLFGAMVSHLDDMAKDIAAMQILGPNPEHQFQWLKSFAEREAAIEMARGNPDAADRARKSLALASDMWDAYTGAASIPVDEKLARWGATTRSYLNGADLGSAILTDMPSAPIFGTMARAFAGVSLKGDMGQLGRLLADPELRGHARRMGFINEVARDGLVSTTQDSLRLLNAGEKTAQGMGVFAAKLPAAIVRMQGLSGSFEARKRSFRLSVMAALDDARGKSLATLAKGDRAEKMLATELGARGFTEADWRKISAAVPWEPKPGVRFLRPQDIAKAAGGELGLRVGEMVMNLEQYAVPVSGSLYTRAALLGGARPGTVKGELLRSLIQFKTFLVNANYQYGEELMLRGVRAGFGGAGLAAWNVSWAAGMLGMLTLSGAMSMQLKAIAKGRDPLAMDTPQFWGAALLQGGGLGILGDFFYSATARNGHTAPIAAAGPTGQLLADVWDATAGEGMDLLHRHDGRPHPHAHDATPKRLAHDLAAYTPGASLWWARTAFDRLVVDQLQTLIDPHAKEEFRKSAQRMQHDTGQSSWWERGHVLPSRAPNLAAAAGAPPP